MRDVASALGQLSLYRERSAPAFTADERRLVDSASRYIAHALSRVDALLRSEKVRRDIADLERDGED